MNNWDATFKAALLVGLAPLLSVPSAHAQAVDSEEIVVTAQRREQAINDVPLSLQAFSGEALERQGVTDLGQLIAQIPSASESISQNAGQRQFQIRGVGSIYGDSTVGYYLDDASFSLPSLAGGITYAPLATTWDIDRVEVLRGPQGTLYGQGSLGGTIRFISAEPDLYEFVARGQASTSSTDGGDANSSASVALSIPIQPGVFAVRVSGDYRALGGYVEVPDFPDRENLDDSVTQNYHVSALFTPTEDWRFRLTYMHNENDNDVGTLLDTLDPPTKTQGTNVGVSNYISQYDLLSFFASYDAGSFAIESSSGYIDASYDDVLYFTFFGFPLTSVDSRPQEVFSQEVRLVSSGEGPLNWIVGGYYQDSTSGLNTEITGFLALTAIASMDAEETAAFGEVSYDFLGGRLTPLIGARWSRTERSYRNDDGFGTIDQGAESFETFNPRFNLSYRPNDDTLLYVNIAKGFRSGTFNLPANVANVVGAGVPAVEVVEPDELWSYEAGGKWTLLGGDLEAGLAGYFWRWSNVQVLANPNGLLAALVNAGDAESYGLDLELLYRPGVDGLTLGFNANVNDTTFVSLNPALAAVPTDGLSEGGRVPYTPRVTMSASVDYQWPLGIGAFNGRGTLTYSYMGDQTDASSLSKSDEHNLLNLRIGAENGHWGVFLFGDNVLNDDGAIYAQRNVAGDFLTRNYPRTLGVQLRFNY